MQLWDIANLRLISNAVLNIDVLELSLSTTYHEPIPNSVSTSPARLTDTIARDLPLPTQSKTIKSRSTGRETSHEHRIGIMGIRHLHTLYIPRKLYHGPASSARELTTTRIRLPITGRVCPNRIVKEALIRWTRLIS